MPAFRYSAEIKLFCLEINFIEPIGGAGPKFNSKSETSAFKIQQLATYALLCPAQGFPIPSYR
jgi:hypothetical protein